MYELLTGDGPADGGDSEENIKKPCERNYIFVQKKVKFMVLILTSTIKIGIILVEKSLLLKVVLFIGYGNFVGILIFWSWVRENVESIS